jgi:hypothetical protein
VAPLCPLPDGNIRRRQRPCLIRLGTPNTHLSRARLQKGVATVVLWPELPRQIPGRALHAADERYVWLCECQVKSGQVRSSQVKSGQVRSPQVLTHLLTCSLTHPSTHTRTWAHPAAGQVRQEAAMLQLPARQDRMRLSGTWTRPSQESKAARCRAAGQAEALGGRSVDAECTGRGT